MFTAEAMLSVCLDCILDKVVHDVGEYNVFEDFATYRC